VVGAQPRSCGILFKETESLPVICQYILSLKNLIVNNDRPFQRNSSVHHIQGIITIFTDQMPNFHVFRKIDFVWDQNFQHFTMYSHKS
jgi:hypothetical protein